MLSIAERIKSSDIARRMVHGAFWSLTGTASGKFCILLSGIVCARLLGKEGFGELGMLRSTIGMFIVLGSAGIGVTVTRFISQYRDTRKDYVLSIYHLSNLFAWSSAIIIALILMLFATPIATNILQAPQLSTSVQIGSLLLLASILNASQQGALAGMEDFKAIAINTFGASIAEAVLMALGAWIWGVEGAIIGFGLGIVVLWLTNSWSVRKVFKKAGISSGLKELELESRHILYYYCLPATLSALTVTPAFFAIRALLVKGCGYNELAIFEAADQWKVIILFIPGAISNIALPILSSTSKKQTFKQALKANIILVGIISASIALIISIMSPFIMPLYGSDFGNHLPLIILAISTIFSSIATIIEMAIYSKDRMWDCFWMNLLWALLLIGICHILLKLNYGATAPAMAVLLSYLVKTIYMSVYILKINEAE